MIAHSAVSGIREGRERQRVEPERRSHRRDDPEVRRIQELPDHADRHRSKDDRQEEHDPEEGLSALRVGDEHGQQQPEPGLEHDGCAGEQERVHDAAMEHGVAEDRASVVVEPDEVGEVETLRVVQAEHDAVDERVDQEAGQDHQRRQQEQQVDGAVAT